MISQTINKAGRKTGAGRASRFSSDTILSAFGIEKRHLKLERKKGEHELVWSAKPAIVRLPKALDPIKTAIRRSLQIPIFWREMSWSRNLTPDRKAPVRRLGSLLRLTVRKPRSKPACVSKEQSLRPVPRIAVQPACHRRRPVGSSSSRIAF